MYSSNYTSDGWVKSRWMYLSTEFFWRSNNVKRIKTRYFVRAQFEGFAKEEWIVAKRGIGSIRDNGDSYDRGHFG
jgi:hypothetical protein